MLPRPAAAPSAVDELAEPALADSVLDPEGVAVAADCPEVLLLPLLPVAVEEDPVADATLLLPLLLLQVTSSGTSTPALEQICWAYLMVAA